MDTESKRATWRDYKASAPGARPGFALTLPRQLPDGTEQQVRFDGIEGDYPIDRKWCVPDRPGVRAQIVRQSEALSQQAAIGTWEVRTATDKARALKLLRRMNVGNIKLRIVEP